MPNGDSSYSELSWAEWKGQVGADLKALKTQQESIFNRLGKVREDLAFLKGKAAAYGAGGGGIVAAIIMLVKHFSEKG